MQSQTRISFAAYAAATLMFCLPVWAETLPDKEAVAQPRLPKAVDVTWNDGTTKKPIQFNVNERLRLIFTDPNRMPLSKLEVRMFNGTKTQLLAGEPNVGPGCLKRENWVFNLLPHSSDSYDVTFAPFWVYDKAQRRFAAHTYTIVIEEKEDDPNSNVFQGSLEDVREYLTHGREITIEVKQDLLSDGDYQKKEKKNVEYTWTKLSEASSKIGFVHVTATAGPARLNGTPCFLISILPNLADERQAPCSSVPSNERAERTGESRSAVGQLQ